MKEERCYCEACGKEITCEESEQFNGFCQECCAELEVTDLDALDDEEDEDSLYTSSVTTLRVPSSGNHDSRTRLQASRQATEFGCCGQV